MPVRAPTLLIAALAPLAAATAAELVKHVSREEAALQNSVSVTGVVTCVAYWQTNSFVIASPSDPDGPTVYISGENLSGAVTPMPGGPVSEGDLFEVDGIWVPMHFASAIAAKRFTRLGHIELPPPRQRMLHDFAGGRYDNRRASFKGIVRAVTRKAPDQTELVLAAREGDIMARVHEPFSRVEGFTDAEVMIDGIAMSRYNHRAEFLGIRLEVASIDRITVLTPPPPDPFLAKKVPLNAILAWSPEPPDGHRRRVEGTVTAAFEPDIFYLQSGETAIRVHCVDSCPTNGTPVEVVGFPELYEGIGQLGSAIWRIDDSVAEKIEPIELSDENVISLAYRADFSYVDYDCRLVTIVGRLFRVEHKDGPARLMLDVAGHSVIVLLHANTPSWILNEEQNTPLVRATGIARINLTADPSNPRHPQIASMRLEARDGADLEFVPDAVWRSRKSADRAKTLLYMLAALTATFAGVLAWSWRKAQLRHRKEALLAIERKRMADDLHDTIEQHLAGARILLSTAEENLPPNANAAAKAVAMAGDVLGEAKRQIRDVILNLRHDETLRKPLAMCLREMADKLNGHGIVKVRCKLRGLPYDTPAGAKTDIVAIVQQAITNAIKHGKAKNVVIVSDPLGGGFSLRVLNDGTPFDPACALGPESGHFGLSSMRERARRSGLAFDIGLEGKWTCVKITRIRESANERTRQ